jgi:hypothetical protein
VVNLDDIIEYSANTHGGNDTLLAHMAGRSASGTTTPGDIRKVLAAKQGASTSKRKPAKVNETSKAPATFTLGDTMYYLNTGETIIINGQKYSSNSTMIHYHVGEHAQVLTGNALSTGELMVVFVVMTC